MGDLAKVCEGKGFADSPGYVKGTGADAVSLAGVVVKYTDEAKPEYRVATPAKLERLLAKEAWRVQLAVCVEMKSEGADGQCDGKPAHDASGTLTVREVKTAKVLATRALRLENGPICMTDWNAKGWSPDRAMPSFAAAAALELTALQPDAFHLVSGDSPQLACQGAPVLDAAPYEKGKPTQIFLQYIDADGRGSPPPAPLPYTSSDPKFTPEIALVACIRAKPDKLVKTCDFDGGNKLELHDGSFDVAIVEARTARVLETKSFKAPRQSTTCPVIHAFHRRAEKTIQSADKAVDTFIRSFGAPSPNSF